MASHSKRKRNPHAAEYEILRPSHQDAVRHSATSRTVTFDRHATGRLGQQTEIAEVEISAEDLATLAQIPEYSLLPDDETLNFEYFEQTVQEDDKADEPVAHQIPAKKVKPVSQIILPHYLTLLTQHVSSRIYSQSGCPSAIPTSTS